MNNPTVSTVLRCPQCGSDDIAADAAARWNGLAWEVSSVHDDCGCQECGTEFHTWEAVSEPTE
jgi:predicted RNA-binding Zn-ribbon protein involved in translation (DUF1610 family)